jgi:hypothetical protein
MPPTGLPTDQECSTTALPQSTMPSSLSVLSVETGRSRTPGELDGERMDTSDLPQDQPAVSANIPVLFPHDRPKSSFINQIIIKNIFSLIFNLSRVGLKNEKIVRRGKELVDE